MFEKTIYDELLMKIDSIQKSLYTDIDVLQEAARQQTFNAPGVGGLEDDMMSEISGSRYGGSRIGSQRPSRGSIAGSMQNKLGRRMSGLMGLKAKLGQKREF